MAGSVSNYFKYLIIFLIILLVYHFVGYRILLEYTSLSVNIEQGLPYGAIPGDYQTYYLIALRISEQPLDITSAISFLKNPNHVVPLVLAIVLKITSGYENILYYNLIVNVPISAYIASQLHAVFRRFQINEKKCFILNILVTLSPFCFIAFTQVSKDLFTHLFYAVSIRALFLVYDREFNYYSAVSLGFGSMSILFIRPYQVSLAIFVWIALAGLFVFKDRKISDVVRPGLIALFMSMICVLYSQSFKAETVEKNLSSPTTAFVPGPDADSGSKGTKSTPTDSKLLLTDGESSILYAINELIDEALRTLNEYRAYYTAQNRGSAMVVSEDYVFDSLPDVLFYLPKAISMIAIEPNFVRLLNNNSGYTESYIKLLYLPWAFIVVVIFLFFLYKIFRNYSLDCFLLQAYTLFSLLPYPYLIPNYGNVARYCSFLVLVLFLVSIFSRMNYRRS